MALLISDAVICGEIDNCTKNTVQGWIQLRGLERPLILHLTGNCAEDLAGRCFRFEAAEPPSSNSDCSVDVCRLAPRQIGPTGVMTALGKIQVADCSVEEMLRSAEAGLPAKVSWKQCLFLEWYSQNGRVVVELLHAHVSHIDSPIVATEDDTDDATLLDDEDDPEEECDPYGLFPEELKDLLAEGNSYDESDSDPFQDEELDSVSLMAGDDVPLQVLFDPPLKLWLPHRLNDQQVEESLHALLARLARHGVALDMCEHFTPREAYCLLLEQILPQESIPSELTSSGFVQHFSTHEFCATCLDEIDRDDAEQDASTDEEA